MNAATGKLRAAVEMLDIIAAEDHALDAADLDAVAALIEEALAELEDPDGLIMEGVADAADLIKQTATDFAALATGAS